jgi:nitrogenase cofactor biosynthesis protein NifB
MNESYQQKNNIHPCFGENAHLKYARIHLPVAPNCNIKCNYCSRKYDCPNESRPGVTSKVLTPEQAYNKFLEASKKIDNLSVVGFAGPGDALANFDKVKQTILLIKKDFPDICFCLSTNGLLLPEYAQEIIELGISHVTITINAVNPEIGNLIYSEINYKGKKLGADNGTRTLILNQLSGLELLAKNNIFCKVNIVAIKEINDFHVEEIVKTVKKYGAFKANIMKFIPAENTPFVDKKPLNEEELKNLRIKCSQYLSQMYHCRQCRADAAGLLGQDISDI